MSDDSETCAGHALSRVSQPQRDTHITAELHELLPGSRELDVHACQLGRALFSL